MGTVLINPDTGKAEELDPVKAQALLQQGWEVPLSNQDRMISVPLSEAQKLVKEGKFSQVSDTDRQKLLNEAHYGTAGQQVLTGVEGAAEALAGPTYSAIAPLTGLTTKEDIRARAQTNPLAHIAGEVAGTVGGIALAPEASLPGLIGKAGAAAGKLGAGAGLASKAIGAISRGATEAALYQAAHSMNEAVLGNPQKVGEELLSNVGLAAALGGGLGLALTPLAGGKANLTDLFKKAVNLHNIQNPMGILATEGADLVKKKVIDTFLKARPGVAEALGHMSELSQKIAGKMERYAGGIFGSAAASALDTERFEPGGESFQPASDPLKMDKLGTMVRQYANDPEALAEHLSQNLTPIAAHAPETATALTAAVMSAVTFLANKVPKTDKMAPLDVMPHPANPEIAKFNRYVATVENPMRVMQHIKQATLLPQDLETLQAVYPGLYETMKGNIMNKLVAHISKPRATPIPYKTRLGLSMFLGETLDSTMSPQSIMMNQQALRGSQAQAAGMPKAQMTRPSKAGIGKMTIAMDQTPAQQAAQRRYSRSA